MLGGGRLRERLRIRQERGGFGGQISLGSDESASLAGSQLPGAPRLPASPISGTRLSCLNVDTLKDLRTRAGVTQAELATRLGVRGPAQVSDWEVGRSRPSWPHLRPMAEALGVSLGKLAEAIDATPLYDGTDHRRVPAADRQSVRRAKLPPGD